MEIKRYMQFIMLVLKDPKYQDRSEGQKAYRKTRLKSRRRVAAVQTVAGEKLLTAAVSKERRSPEERVAPECSSWSTLKKKENRRKTSCRCIEGQRRECCRRELFSVTQQPTRRRSQGAGGSCRVVGREGCAGDGHRICWNDD